MDHVATERKRHFDVRRERRESNPENSSR